MTKLLGPSQKLIDKIVKTHNILELLVLLINSPYLSWIDVRLITAMFKGTSSSAKVLDILESYKHTIYSKKLTDVLPDYPSKEIKEEYFTKIVAKIDRDA